MAYVTRNDSASTRSANRHKVEHKAIVHESQVKIPTMSWSEVEEDEKFESRQRAGGWTAFQNNSKFYSNGAVLQAIQHMLARLEKDPVDAHMAVWKVIKSTIRAVLEDEAEARKTHPGVLIIQPNVVLGNDITFRLLVAQQQLHQMEEQGRQRHLNSRQDILAIAIWLLLGVYHQMVAVKIPAVSRYQEEILTTAFRRVVERIVNDYLEFNATRIPNNPHMYTKIRHMQPRLFDRMQKIPPRYQGDPLMIRKGKDSIKNHDHELQNPDFATKDYSVTRAEWVKYKKWASRVRTPTPPYEESEPWDKEEEDISPTDLTMEEPIEIKTERQEDRGSEENEITT